MKDRAKNLLISLRPTKVTSILSTFLRDESISGKIILGAVMLSLIAVNSSLSGIYDKFWLTQLSIGLGGLSINMDLRHWLNEGLMAFFFLTVGLEIKRELVKGELREFRAAILPIGAAVGGMIVPAVLYLAFNFQTEDAIKGWGIPIATDIAFAVAVLSLLGTRVPIALKVFLLTLAIADDIGAIFVIALFYAEIIHVGFLITSFAIISGIFLLRKQLIDRLGSVIVLGAVLWVTTHLSGIHASIVGAAMGLLAPVAVRKNQVSVAERVEKFVLPIVTFLVLPLFAFANAGFVLSLSAVSSHQSVMWGILAGLVVGKMAGITLASWLLVKFKIADLPKGMNWQHVIGVGFIAGIGFTVSIFITELAFLRNEQLLEAAKITIFAASILSAVAGSLVLLRSPKMNTEE